MYFRPRKMSSESVSEQIENCIKGIISPDADIVEMKWWMSILPEALRYCYRKRKKILRAIEQIELKLEEIDAKFKLVYIHSSYGNGSISERKDFADAMKKAKSKEYKKYMEQLSVYNELLNNVDADIINLQEKSTSIRKFTNIETSRVIYEDD